MSSFSKCLIYTMSALLLALLHGCHGATAHKPTPDEPRELRQEELNQFREAATPLEEELRDRGVGEINFAGTLSAHSGDAVIMIAPLEDPPSPEDLVRNGGVFGVLWLSDDPVTRPSRPALQRGIYLLRFTLNGGSAEIGFITSQGSTAYEISASPSAGLQLCLGDEIEDAAEDVQEEVEEALEDIEVPNLIDVEIEYGDPDGPTVISGSALFWSFEIAEDP